MRQLNNAGPYCVRQLSAGGRQSERTGMYLGLPLGLGTAVESLGLAARGSFALTLGSLALAAGSLRCRPEDSLAATAALPALGCSCCHCSSDRVGRPVCFFVGTFLSAPIDASQATTSFLQPETCCSALQRFLLVAICCCKLLWPRTCPCKHGNMRMRITCLRCTGS